LAHAALNLHPTASGQQAPLRVRSGSRALHAATKKASGRRSNCDDRWSSLVSL